ncbi:hypothetical protein [Nocardioides abyssi]|uniref:Small CPxCG-related zinc finger protein n=1 Tax=Nocardioides abyssi TaxID=3058370 RepID=A0ABT8ER55_9ACTN|nr:hypothetical protein [Nocardioides abyssi]MDN4160401.1 hypothetical protein [Nocardioides abyssi]
MTSRTKEKEDRPRDDPGACPRCGEALLPQLTATARPADEEGPLCAEPSVRLACPSCG